MASLRTRRLLSRLRVAMLSALVIPVLTAVASASATTAPGVLTISGAGNRSSAFTLHQAITLHFDPGDDLGIRSALHQPYLGFLIENASEHQALFGLVRLRNFEHWLSVDHPAPLPLMRSFDVTLTPGRYLVYLYGSGPSRITIRSTSGTAHLTLTTRDRPVAVDYQLHALPRSPSTSSALGSRFPITTDPNSVLYYGVVHLASPFDVQDTESHCLATAGASTCLGQRPYPSSTAPLGVGSYSTGSGNSTAAANNYLPGELPPAHYDFLINQANVSVGSQDIALSFLAD